MDTRNKLRIASVLSKTIRRVRSAVGLETSNLVCSRAGIAWDLDLSEGIDLSIYLFGGFEKSTARAISRHLRAGAVALDIGANIGAHALSMAKLVGPTGRVYAFEPTQWAHQKLLRNIDLNPGLKETLVPLQVFLSDRRESLPGRIHSSWNLDQQGDHPIHGGVFRSAENARALTLDEWAREAGLDRLDFIKIDVDGFEGRILRGGSETLKKFRPPLILELTPYALEESQDSLEELLGFLSRMNYGLWTENGGRRISMAADRVRARMPKRGGINTLALFSG